MSAVRRGGGAGSSSCATFSCAVFNESPPETRERLESDPSSLVEGLDLSRPVQRRQRRLQRAHPPPSLRNDKNSPLVTADGWTDGRTDHIVFTSSVSDAMSRSFRGRQAGTNLPEDWRRSPRPRDLQSIPLHYLFTSISSLLSIDWHILTSSVGEVGRRARRSKGALAERKATQEVKSRK